MVFRLEPLERGEVGPTKDVGAHRRSLPQVYPSRLQEPIANEISTELARTTNLELELF
jgi:hypothetical protein